jgi:hypothetical protein
MKPFNSRSKTSGAFALLSMFIAVTALPSTAAARGSVHIDLPHFSVGLHDNNHGIKYRDSHRNRHYNNNSRGSRHSNRHDKKRHHNNHNYYGGSYNNNYYDGYSSYGSTNRYYKPRKKRYNRSYRNEYCPTPGYSSYNYSDRGCYSHGDHYHCDG